MRAPQSVRRSLSRPQFYLRSCNEQFKLPAGEAQFASFITCVTTVSTASLHTDLPAFLKFISHAPNRREHSRRTCMMDLESHRSESRSLGPDSGESKAAGLIPKEFFPAISPNG